MDTRVIQLTGLFWKNKKKYSDDTDTNDNQLKIKIMINYSQFTVDSYNSISKDSHISVLANLFLLGNITHRAINSEIHLHTPTSRQCSKRCLLV